MHRALEYMFAMVTYSCCSSPRSVGMYGNADPGDVSQWISMDYKSQSASSEWSETTSTCSNMVSGI